ncbi:microtubule-associated protein 4-like isoform X2 [Narcine bancroftii]|uniref:microtubule-associated protein 4-like isoform X2 n=1 Tax=Narcine bancroftii TaxID=1343680 RepID=UPI003831B1AF
MADFNLIDALHESTPNVELEVKRDFISSLEAEKYDDVVGESVTKENYVPLVDETKLPPSEAEGKAVGYMYGETGPQQETDGQLAENSKANERGPGELPNGEHGGGPADITDDWILSEEGNTLRFFKLEARRRERGTIERCDAGHLVKFEPMLSSAHEMSFQELQHLNSPTEVAEDPTFERRGSPELIPLSSEEMASQEGEIQEGEMLDTTLKTRDSMAAVTAPVAFEEDLCVNQEEIRNGSMTLLPAEVESITELEGNLIAEVKPLEQNLVRAELPLAPAQECMESTQKIEDYSHPSLSSGGILDDHLVSNMMKTEVAFVAQLQTPINNSLSTLQQENFSHATEPPAFTEPFPPTCRNIDFPMGSVVLTSTTTTKVAPISEVSPLEHAPVKNKFADEVRETTQVKDSHVVKIAGEKKKKKKKRSHQKASQPVADVPAKGKDVHRIISDQRIEELPAGVIQEHREILLNTERSCKETSRMKEKAHHVDNASRQNGAWATGNAGDKMACAPLQNTKTSSEDHKPAVVTSQRGDVVSSENISQVELISKAEWTEHPLDSWSKEVTSSKPLQTCEVEEVVQPYLEPQSGEISSCKSEVNKLAITSLDLGELEHAPPEPKKVPEIKEIDVSTQEHVNPKSAPSVPKGTSGVNEIAETLLENKSRKIDVPESQEPPEMEEVEQIHLKFGDGINTSPGLQQSSEVKEMAETPNENICRETTSLERKEAPQVKDMASPCVENFAEQNAPLQLEHISEVKEMMENSPKLVSTNVAPPASEVNDIAEIPLRHTSREIGSLDSQQTPVVKEMAEILIENVDTPSVLNELPEMEVDEHSLGHSFEQIAEQTIPYQTTEASVVTKLAEIPLNSLYRETVSLEPEQKSEVKEITQSPLQYVGQEMGSVELKQTEMKEVVENPLTSEIGDLELQRTSEVIDKTEAHLEDMNTETQLDLYHASTVKQVVGSPLDHCSGELTSTELQQKSETKEHVESPLEYWNSETASPELPQSPEVNEMVESPLECQTEVRLSKCSDQVAPLSLKHEASKHPGDNEKSPKSPLRKGGAKILQKHGFAKAQKETGAKISPEQHKALKSSAQPKISKALNQRRGDGDDPLKPKEFGNVHPQSDQRHLDEGSRQDEAKLEEPTTEDVTKIETATVSKEHPLTSDTKGKAGTLTTKISPTKTKSQPSASLKRPATAAPSPNKKLNTSAMTAATTAKRLPSSLARSSSATTKDVKSKATEVKSPVKPPSSRPPSAGVTKTSSNTTVKSSTSLQKVATTAGSTPRNTTLSTPRRPTSIKTEPKSTEMRKSLSAKSPLGETGRPKAATTTPIKSTGASPSTPSTPFGVSSPGTPSSSTSRAPRTLALKTTAASEAKRVIPVPRVPSKTTVAAGQKQPRPASAPAPDLKNIKSKIGSTDNIKHQPGGGKAKTVEKKPEPLRLNRKVESSTMSRIAKTTTTKDSQKQTNGKVQIVNKKVDYSHVQSKCGSKDNIKHIPGGGNVQIPKAKVDVIRASSKCGSKTNIKHKAGGGDVKIESSKTDFKNKAESKIGSLDNLNHTPGGGNVKNEGEEESESATISQTPENGALTGQAESGTQEHGVGMDPTAGSDETHSQELQIQETY